MGARSAKTNKTKITAQNTKELTFRVFPSLFGERGQESWSQIKKDASNGQVGVVAMVVKEVRTARVSKPGKSSE